ncbi:MAG: 4Fe-4S cluster-binding domain-containing protein [Elusimicrobiales bacterium]|nr:4Fe-4S cluster-binding domain-containing protein [Elusimicrobiales bacterium]
MSFRKSSFIVDCGRDPEGKRQYFNTLSRKFILLPGELEALAAAPGTDARVLEFLKKGKWLTPAASYEEELRDALDLITAAGSGSSALSVVFTVTTKCNLNCSYCFQNNAERMDAPAGICAALPGFIRKEAQARPAVKKVRLSLFGGEPLLRQEACLALLDSVQRECADLSLQFEAGIVTNGLGAAPDFWRAAAKSGLKKVQVTIDGSEKVHDAFRRLNGAGTYGPLLALCGPLSETFQLSLKYNLNRRSAEGFGEFVGDLAARGFNKANTHIVLEAVKAIDYNEAGDYYFPADSNEAGDAYAACAEAGLRAGWQVTLTHLFQPPCMYTQVRPSSLVIRPDGGISRCISVYNDDTDFSAGNITDAAPLPGNAAIRAVIEDGAGNCKAAKCPLFPVCMTGCPSHKKLKFGTIKTAFCRRAHIEKTIKDLGRIRSKDPKVFERLEF